MTKLPGGTGHHPTPAEAAAMCREYEAGVGLVPLCLKYGVSVTTVRVKLREGGVKTRPRGHRSPQGQARFDERIKAATPEIVTARRRGDSIKDIGITLRMDPAVVKRVLVDQGEWHGRRSLRRFSDETCRRIRAEYEAGLSTLDLAERYGSDDRSMRRMIIKAGGTIRAKGIKRSPEMIARAKEIMNG